MPKGKGYNPGRSKFEGEHDPGETGPGEYADYMERKAIRYKERAPKSFVPLQTVADFLKTLHETGYSPGFMGSADTWVPRIELVWCKNAGEPDGNGEISKIDPMNALRVYDGALNLVAFSVLRDHMNHYGQAYMTPDQARLVLAARQYQYGGPLFSRQAIVKSKAGIAYGPLVGRSVVVPWHRSRPFGAACASRPSVEPTLAQVAAMARRIMLET